MSDFLKEIEARTRQRVDMMKTRTSIEFLKKRMKDMGPVRGFHNAIRQTDRLTLIAELKQASPSAGLIRAENDMEGRMECYTQGGASALSILTEEEYFRGSPELLERAKRTIPLPLLRKDFLLDSYQVIESRVLGADAVLLIAALLGPVKLRDMVHYVQDAEMDSLVEIHDEWEIDAALNAEADIIGINNRDLRSLKVDPATAQRLAPRVPKDRTLVIESGVKEPQEMTRYRFWGAHAVLIGEALMRSDDPEKLVRSFVEAGKQ